MLDLFELNIKTMNEALQDKNHSKRKRAFSNLLSLYWAGVIAEMVCFPGPELLTGGRNDERQIGKRLFTIEGLSEGGKQTLSQEAALNSMKIIKRNRLSLRRLAKKLYSMLMNNPSVKIESMEVMKILSTRKEVKSVKPEPPKKGR